MGIIEVNHHMYYDVHSIIIEKMSQILLNVGTLCETFELSKQWLQQM